MLGLGNADAAAGLSSAPGDFEFPASGIVLDSDPRLVLAIGSTWVLASTMTVSCFVAGCSITVPSLSLAPRVSSSRQIRLDGAVKYDAMERVF